MEIYVKSLLYIQFYVYTGETESWFSLRGDMYSCAVLSLVIFLKAFIILSLRYIFVKEV